MRFFLRRAESLRAGAVHVSRGVMGTPANLRSETTAPGSPSTDVCFAAVHGERQAGGEVCESWGLTVADHPEQR